MGTTTKRILEAVLVTLQADGCEFQPRLTPTTGGRSGRAGGSRGWRWRRSRKGGKARNDRIEREWDWDESRRRRLELGLWGKKLGLL
jgi:hypothetical protein